MTDQQVHLLWATQLYEGGTLLAIYANKEEAERVRLACTKHQESKPPYPESENPSDTEIDSFWALDEAWATAHPGGQYARYADEFTVESMPVIDAKE